LFIIPTNYAPWAECQGNGHPSFPSFTGRTARFPVPRDVGGRGVGFSSARGRGVLSYPCWMDRLARLRSLSGLSSGASLVSPSWSAEVGISGGPVPAGDGTM